MPHIEPTLDALAFYSWGGYGLYNFCYGSYMIWVYPWALRSSKNPSIAHSGPYLYWYILSVLKTVIYMFSMISWLLVALISSTRGDSLHYLFLVMMKVCALQPLLVNILMGLVIFFRYDSYNYIRSEDKNFIAVFSMLLIDTIGGWFVYIYTFSDMLLNYQVFQLYREGWCMNEDGKVYPC